ncbi:MAG: phosphoenolpyruvate--protein phosphotransferase [Veillonellaceae bacterium]|nr:phosphoenolpyruvate--protein phosphotransferase [Veillonellaceae bacterium]
MILKGIGAASGFAVANCRIIRPAVDPVISTQTIAADQLEAELQHFHDAVAQAMEQLAAILQRARQRGDTIRAEIIEAQSLMLTDPTIDDDVRDKIVSRSFSAVRAVQETIAEQAEILAGLEDPYLRERSADVRDIGMRLTAILQGTPLLDLSNLTEEVILVGHEITTSQMATLDSVNVRGIIAEVGGKTSHTAILAKNIGIPAVLACTGILESIRDGDRLALDGDKGIVETAITEHRFREIKYELIRRVELRDALEGLAELPTQTRDGFRVRLLANIIDQAGADKAMQVGADGIGLYRTEFLFVNRETAPTEDEQYEAYAAVVRTMRKKPVLIRTLDIGGDKPVPYLKLSREDNPVLGCRAIRICLQDPALFKIQLRAILRAGVHGQALILYPMITSLDEVRAANRLLAEAKESLRAEGVAFDANLKSGIMVEIPSAALTADLLIRETDFFSIGSNDLTQYTLAVDRLNETIGSLYSPFHPGVLRLIRTVVNTVNRTGNGKFAGMCGEMAADPAGALLLLGLGLTEFSVNPAELLKIKKMITSVSRSYAQDVADKAMQLATADEIQALLKAAMPPELQAYL